MEQIASVQPFTESGDVNAIVETPAGERNKYKYDSARGLFQLSHVLPEGAVFPFEFGFIPGTKAEDGDPLDVLLITDAPTAMGCLITVRLVGAIEAEQTEDGKTERNDRLIALPLQGRRHRDVRNLADLGNALLDEVEHFFVSYNEMRGKQFRPVGRTGAEGARRLLDKAIERAGR